jgi:hypothetical protein
MKKTISPARARPVNSRLVQTTRVNARPVQTTRVNSRLVQTKLIQALALLALSAGPALADNQEGAACVRTWSQPGSASESASGSAVGSAVGTLISQKPVDLGYGLCMDKEGKTAAAVSIIQTIGKDGTCGLRDDQRTAGQEYCQAFGSQFDFKLADDTPSSGATETAGSNTPKLVDGKTNGLPMTLQQAQLVSKNLDLKVSVDKPESKLLVMATLANKAPDKSPFNKSPFESLSLFRKNFSTDIKLTPLALGVTSESMDDSSRQDMLLAIAAGGTAAGIKTGNNMVKSFQNKKAQADAERWAAKNAETAKTQAETAKKVYQENLERIQKETAARQIDIDTQTKKIKDAQKKIPLLEKQEQNIPTEQAIKQQIENLSPKEAAPPKTIEEQIEEINKKYDQNKTYTVRESLSQAKEIEKKLKADLEALKNPPSGNRQQPQNTAPSSKSDELNKITSNQDLIKKAMIEQKELELQKHRALCYEKFVKPAADKLLQEEGKYITNLSSSNSEDLFKPLKDLAELLEKKKVEYENNIKNIESSWNTTYQEIKEGSQKNLSLEDAKRELKNDIYWEEYSLKGRKTEYAFDVKHTINSLNVILEDHFVAKIPDSEYLEIIKNTNMTNQDIIEEIKKINNKKEQFQSEYDKITHPKNKASLSQKESKVKKTMSDLTQKIPGIDIENLIKSSGSYDKLFEGYSEKIKTQTTAYEEMEKFYKNKPDGQKAIKKHKELVEQLKTETDKLLRQNLNIEIETIKAKIQNDAKDLDSQKLLKQEEITATKENLKLLEIENKKMIEKQEAQSKEIEEITQKIKAEDRKIQVADFQQNKKPIVMDDSETSTQRRGGILPSQDTLKNFTVEAAKVLGVGTAVALVTAGVAAGVDYYVPAFCDQNTGEPGEAGTDPIFLGCLDPWTLAIKIIYSVIYKRSKSAGCRLPDLALKAAQKACQTAGGILSPMPVNSSYLVTNFPNLFDTSDQRSAMKKEFEGVTFDDQGKPWQTLEGKEVFATQNLDRDKAIKNTSPDQKAPA